MLAVVVPFHNEEHYLPRLIGALREQTAREVPVVFVDNASTDRSAALLGECQEIASGRWILIRERTVGKFHAMAAATRHCQKRLGAEHVAFLDADSYWPEADWLSHAADLTARANGTLGYVYSPHAYAGHEHLPFFATALEACHAVTRFVAHAVGWFGNAAGAVFAAEVLAAYFRQAAVTSELGLRLSLLALSQGRHGYLNPGVLITSARRLVIDNPHFHAWCFYDREFYRHKDINQTVKLDLRVRPRADDLDPSLIPRLFHRQSTKIAARNLIPLALFDRSGQIADSIHATFGLDLTPTLDRLRPSLVASDIFTERFDALLEVIEAHPLAAALSLRIEDLMHRRHRDLAVRPVA